MLAYAGLSAALKTEIEQEVKRFNDPHYYKEKQWDSVLSLRALLVQKYKY